MPRVWSEVLEYTHFNTVGSNLTPGEQEIILNTIEIYLFGVHQNSMVRYMETDVKKYCYSFLHTISYNTEANIYIGQLYEPQPNLPRLMKTKPIGQLAPPFSRCLIKFTFEDYARLFPAETSKDFRIIMDAVMSNSYANNIKKTSCHFIAVSAFSYLHVPTKHLPCPYCGLQMELLRVSTIATSLGAVPFGNSELSVFCNCNYCSSRLCYNTLAFRCKEGHGLCLKCMKLELNELNSIITNIKQFYPRVPMEIARMISGFALGMAMHDNDW